MVGAFGGFSSPHLSRIYLTFGQKSEKKKKITAEVEVIGLGGLGGFSLFFEEQVKVRDRERCPSPEDTCEWR